MNLGDFAAGVTVRAWTHTEDSSRVPVTLTSVTAYCLKNGSASEITAGVSMTVDVGHTGAHRIDVVLATAGFAAGDNGAIYYTATESGTSVRRLVAVFSVENRLSTPANLLDLAGGVEAGLTLRQYFRLGAAALFGKLSGAGTSTVTIRNFSDTKNRIVATVDADGNRSAFTYDAT